MTQRPPTTPGPRSPELSATVEETQAAPQSCAQTVAGDMETLASEPLEGAGHTIAGDTPLKTTPLQPGTLVDHFQVLHLIGQGGMGAVFAARDLELGRRVALKMILPGRLGSDVAVRRFVQEARTTARFSHPNIVGIYAVGTFQGAPYVALEYVEGESLRSRITARDRSTSGQAMSARATLRTALSIAEALAEAHKHGITHRDLKPDNVMIGVDGRLRVLDFGLASTIGEGDADDAKGRDRSAAQEPITVSDSPAQEPAQPKLTDADRWVGTPAYMAPEQFALEPIGPAADIWALGIILHELITGTRPYGDVASLPRLAQVVTSTEPVPDLGAHRGVPSEVAGLVSRCLHKDPAKRPTASQVASVIGRLVGGASALSDEDNPFRGLMAFDEAQAGWYFGREREILLAIERLRHSPVVPVVGPSGAGKSSLVHAGLIPRWRELAATIVIRVRPGTHPLRALATQVLRAGASPNTDSGEPVDSRTRAATLDGAHKGPGIDAPRTDDDLLGGLATVEAPDTRPAPALTALGARAEVDASTAEGQVSYETEDDANDTAEGTRQLTGVANRPHPSDIATLAETFRRSPHALNLKLSELAVRSGRHVMLVVDQLEEVFGAQDAQTGDGDDGDAERFIANLGRAADDPAGPVRVVFTLRDDFLGRVATGPAIQQALAGVVVVRTPDAHALEETLRGPVRAAGYAFEDEALPTEMVATVAGSQAALPLLQFTASLMWERRDRGSRTLTRQSYEALGGVHGALASHAEGVLGGLSDKGLIAARTIFERLVASDGTRRVRTQPDALAGLPSIAANVLERLSVARLVVTRKGDGGEALVEIAHESLVTEWARLRRWLADSSEDQRLIEDLGERQSQWSRRGHPDAELIRGPAVAEALAMVRRRDDVPPRIVHFVERSRKAQRRGRWWARMAAATVVIASIAVAIGMFAQKEAAERESSRADQERRKAEAVTQTLSERNAALTLAKARAQLDRDPTLAAATLKQLIDEPSMSAQVLTGVIQEAHRRGVATHVFRGHRDEVRRVAFSPDGQTLASAAYDDTVRLWSLTDETVQVLRGHAGEVKLLAWSPDGRHLMSAGRGGEVRLWTPDGVGRLLGTHSQEVSAAAWAPDGRTLTTGSESGAVRHWSPTNGLLRTDRAHTAEIEHLQWRGDGGALLSTSEDGTARLWTPAKGSVLVATHTGYLRSGTLSADGGLIATGGGDGLIRVRYSDGRILEHQAHRHEVRAVRYNPVRGELLSASRDGTVALWRLASDKRETIRIHTAPIRDLIVSPDGRFFATGSEDKTAQLWRADRSDHQTLLGHDRRIRHLAFSPDSSKLATASSDGTVRVWSTALERRPLLVGHTTPVESVALSAETADGSSWAATSAGREVRLWELGGTLQRSLGSHRDVVRSVAFSPSGHRLISGGRGGQVKVWDVSRGEPLAELKTGMKVAQVLSGPDGASVVAVGSIPEALYWKRPEAPPLVLRGHRDEIVRAAFLGPDHLVTGSMDRRVLHWDLSSGQGRPLGTMGDDVTVVAGHAKGLVAVGAENGQLQLWAGEARSGISKWGAHDGPIRALVVQSTRDAVVVASGGDDRVVRLWDAQGTSRGELRGHRGAVTGAAFVPGNRLLTSGEGGALWLWDLANRRGFELGRVGAPIAQMGVDPAGLRVLVDGTKDVPWWRIPPASGITSAPDGLQLQGLTSAVLTGEDAGLEDGLAQTPMNTTKAKGSRPAPPATPPE